MELELPPADYLLKVQICIAKCGELEQIYGSNRNTILRNWREYCHWGNISANYVIKCIIPNDIRIIVHHISYLCDNSDNCERCADLMGAIHKCEDYIDLTRERLLFAARLRHCK
jgi:hypothetical protein